MSFFKGYRSKTSGKEKEVDVKLSVDMVGFGLLDNYKTAYLLTGDADFLQAAIFLKKYRSKIRVSLLCLANKVMFKGLYDFPSNIIQFKNKLIKLKDVARKTSYLYLNDDVKMKVGG